MSGRTTVVKRLLRDVIVYWGGAASDGEGGRTFSDAIEIRCRWLDKTQVYIDPAGQQATSLSMLYVDQDLEVGGYVARVTLKSLTPAQVHDAFQVPSSREIKQFQTTPGLHDDTITVRKAWL